MIDIERDIQIAKMEINKIFEQLTLKIQQHTGTFGVSDYSIQKSNNNYESILQLNSNTALFKGKKPTGIIFGGGERKDVGTWKKVFELVLKDCIADPERHVNLLELRGKISGRERLILSDKPDGMRSPFEITDHLFIESHFDTTNLLHILLNRILKPIGYDYTNIKIAIRNN